jgi:hypothetical protein
LHDAVSGGIHRIDTCIPKITKRRSADPVALRFGIAATFNLGPVDALSASTATATAPAARGLLLG